MGVTITKKFFLSNNYLLQYYYRDIYLAGIEVHDSKDEYCDLYSLQIYLSHNYRNPIKAELANDDKVLSDDELFDLINKIDEIKDIVNNGKEILKSDVIETKKTIMLECCVKEPRIFGLIDITKNSLASTVYERALEEDAYINSRFMDLSNDITELDLFNNFKIACLLGSWLGGGDVTITERDNQISVECNIR